MTHRIQRYLYTSREQTLSVAIFSSLVVAYTDLTDLHFRKWRVFYVCQQKKSKLFPVLTWRWSRCGRRECLLLLMMLQLSVHDVTHTQSLGAASLLQQRSLAGTSRLMATCRSHHGCLVRATAEVASAEVELSGT